MARPRVGVVVLNWNGRDHLEPCLHSLTASLDCDFFVIVVDNGSVDGSAEWVRAHHPHVEVIALDENRRFAAGNNAGAERALDRGADIVLLLNNDTVVAPELLAQLTEVFVAHPGAGIVGPRIVYADRPERIWYGGGEIDLRLGILRHRALRRDAHENSDPEGETEWVTGCALAVRAGLWRELGGLDDDFYIYAEDVDFCLRARRAGWSIRYTPRATLRHAVSASVGGHGSAFKAYHKTRSRLQLLERHGRGPVWPASVLLQDLATVFWHLLRGAPAAAAGTVQAWFDRGRARPRHPTTELEDPNLRAASAAAMMGRAPQARAVERDTKENDGR